MKYWLENPGESLSQGPERWRSFDLVEGHLIPFQQEGMLRDASVCVCMCVHHHGWSGFMGLVLSWMQEEL